MTDPAKELKDWLDSWSEDVTQNTEKLLGKQEHTYNSGAFCPLCGDEMRKTRKQNTRTNKVHDVFYCFRDKRYFRWEKY